MLERNWAFLEISEVSVPPPKRRKKRRLYKQQAPHGAKPTPSCPAYVSEPGLHRMCAESKARGRSSTLRFVDAAEWNGISREDTQER